MAVSNRERIEVLQEVLEKMDEIAHTLRRLDDKRINAYCLAAFEGQQGGWLGHFERDVLEEALDSVLHPDPADEEEEAY
jgi:hypothetical protein